MDSKVQHFLDDINTLPLDIPLFKDIADLALHKDGVNGPLKQRMERRYRRLIRVQDELRCLDLKKASPGVGLEDFVFSQIDFSRYQTIAENDFDHLFLAGLSDFDESLYQKNFNLSCGEIQSIITVSYEKTEKKYTLTKKSAVVLSVMRMLETSLESLPLFSAKEIIAELQTLPVAVQAKLAPYTHNLYPLLVSALNGAVLTHSDGMTTTLSISPSGDLSGIFHPANKAWTLVLIPVPHGDSHGGNSLA